MMNVFKRMICRHDYRKAGTELRHKNKHYIVPMTKLKCVKCGKVVWK